MIRSNKEIQAQLRAQIAAIEERVPSDFVLDTNATGSSKCCMTDSKSLASLESRKQITEDSGSCSVDNTQESFADESERAFRKIERVAVIRDQASTALRKRLVREGFSPEAVETALVRAIACGLVDDVRYADILIRSRLSQGRGIQGIEAELASLDIDSSSIIGWPDEFLFDEDDELSRALKLLNLRPPRAKNKREAAYRKLMQKGFGSSVASSAARLWSEEQGS